VADFPHPSRPGHYGVVLDDDLKAALTVLVSALIPGAPTYPSGGQAQVVDFIETRSSETDREMAREVVARCDHDSVSSATAALRVLEGEDPLLFAWIRDFAYYGYYASRRVLASMSEHGYAYHGAPQPLGYAITEEMLVPAAGRGSYIATEEVTRAQDR
jgi:hypothetical protein